MGRGHKPGVKLNTKRGRTALEKLADFERSLPRALNLAVNNSFVLKPGIYHPLRDIRKLWGYAAEQEFKRWFVCEREICKERLDRLQYLLEAGKITLKVYAYRLRTWAYHPVWTLRQERRLDAYLVVTEKLTA